MADLVITDANVRLAAQTTTIRKVQLGEAVGRSEPVKLAADGKYYKAFGDSVANAETAGITLTGGVLDGWVVIVQVGDMEPGATLTLGTEYVLSANAAGKIAPKSDLATGDIYTSLGRAKTTAILTVDIENTAIVMP